MLDIKVQMSFEDSQCGQLAFNILAFGLLVSAFFSISNFFVLRNSKTTLVKEDDDIKWSQVKTYRKDENWLVTPFELVSARQNAVADTLLKSWNSEPFVDVVVVDQAKGLLASCPESHP